MGIMVGERSVWGKGYCQESVRLVTDYAFSTMGLTKIKLGVIVENVNAINCYKKSGFVIEKTKPYTGINRDTYKNSFSMSISKGSER
jgi:RimJ/RimL family protein N-acetyltransferase